MSIIGASFVVVGFAVLAHFIGLLRWTAEVMAHVKESVATLNSDLDDHAKEKALQSSAIKLFKLLGLLLIGSALALFTPIAVVWLFDIAGLISLGAVLDMLQRWEFLVAATVIGFAVFSVILQFNS